MTFKKDDKNLRSTSLNLSLHLEARDRIKIFF